MRRRRGGGGAPPSASTLRALHRRLAARCFVELVGGGQINACAPCELYSLAAAGASGAHEVGFRLEARFRLGRPSCWRRVVLGASGPRRDRREGEQRVDARAAAGLGIHPHPDGLQHRLHPCCWASSDAVELRAAHHRQLQLRNQRAAPSAPWCSLSGLRVERESTRRLAIERG